MFAKFAGTWMNDVLPNMGPLEDVVFSGELCIPKECPLDELEQKGEKTGLSFLNKEAVDGSIFPNALLPTISFYVWYL